MFAHVAPIKGIHETGFVVDALADDVKGLRYHKVTLNSHHEPAIVELLPEALKELRMHGLKQTMEEQSPEYGPQAVGVPRLVSSS